MTPDTRAPVDGLVERIRIIDLTPSMRHVISRCSEVETWERTGQTFGRQWPDLVAGRSHVSMSTIRALMDRGLVYRDSDGLFGLTSAGMVAWLDLRLSRNNPDAR